MCIRNRSIQPTQCLSFFEQGNIAQELERLQLLVSKKVIGVQILTNELRVIVGTLEESTQHDRVRVNSPTEGIVMILQSQILELIHDLVTPLSLCPTD